MSSQTENGGRPLDLNDIRDAPPDEGVPDPLTEIERKDLEKSRKSAELRSYLQNIGERKKYADKIYKLVKYWLLAVGGLLLFHGFLSPRDIFALPQAVLVTVVGGTTVSVIGLFLVVARYLFAKRES